MKTSQETEKTFKMKGTSSMNLKGKEYSLIRKAQTFTESKAL